MNTSNGFLIGQEELEKLPPPEQKKYIPIYRDLSLKELAGRQIALYSPCACGSGKKFKFCHYKKDVA